jgi:PucR family transcriptional regulator, purine catabolism regulatory protein
VTLTVSQVLALEPFQDAEPELLAGPAGLDNPVRWVHSSEIYEISPLLSGRELLLTTGLGLAGSDAGARRHYIREIADTGLSALAMEVGRTFTTVPPELVDEARKHSLPLIALNRVVPFIRMSEAANTAIIHSHARRLERTAALSHHLDTALISGDGVRGLLAIAATELDAPLVLVAENGVIVSAHGLDDERAAHHLAAVPAAEAALQIRGQPWGRVCVGPPTGMDTEDLHALLERLAIALTLSLLGTGLPPGDPERQAAALLDDLLAGGNMAATDFIVRAGLAGLHPQRDASLIGVAVESAQSAPALALIDQAASKLSARALRARVRGQVLGIFAVPAGPGEPVSAVAAALTTAHQAQVGDVTRVMVGPAGQMADAPACIARSLIDARDAMTFTPRNVDSDHGSPSVVVTTRSLAMELHLSRLPDAQALELLGAELVGPLITWDKRHPTSLLQTLETYLRHGCSPTRTAEALYLGRHSVYQRLQRIESLLGLNVSDPQMHAGLLLATVAARIRLRPQSQ